MAEESEKELEQMRRLNTFRRFVQAIVKRRIWIIALMFVLAAVVTGKFVIARAKRATDRYQAATVLIYSPKNSRNVRIVDNQEVLKLICRREMSVKLADKLHLDPTEIGRIEVQQERNQRNIFSVTIFAPDEKTAVLAANEFARLCSSEYAAYRGADLAKNWEMPILLREKQALEARQALDRAEAELRAKHGDIDLASVRSDSQGLSGILRQRHEELFACEKDLSDWRLRSLKAKTALELIPPPVISNISTLVRLKTNYDTAMNEWEELSSQYTERHPRLLLKQEQCKRALEGLKASLAELKTPDFPVEAIGRVGGLVEDTVKAAEELERVTSRREGLVQEIDRLEKRRQSLVDVKNEMDRIDLQRERLPSPQEHKNELVEIQDLESAASSELTQVERVQHAIGESILSKRNFIVIAGVGFAFASLILAVVVLLELAIGKIANAVELSFHPELLPLGALPKGDAFASEEEQKSVTDGIFFRFHNAGIKWGTIFMGCLPGGERSEVLESSFTWNFAMSGDRTLSVRIVKAIDFTEPEDAVFLGGVVRSGTNAWFPVSNDESLSPGELQLLAGDMKTLKEEFDVITITRDKPVRSGDLAVAQLFSFCDSVLLMVGIGKTRRADLRAIIELDRRHSETPIPVVATGLKGHDALKEGNAL